MKSLTLHALDSQLAAQLKRCAEEQSVSMNELAKRILSEDSGSKRRASRHRTGASFPISVACGPRKKRRISRPRHRIWAKSILRIGNEEDPS